MFGCFSNTAIIHHEEMSLARGYSDGASLLLLLESNDSDNVQFKIINDVLYLASATLTEPLLFKTFDGNNVTHPNVRLTRHSCPE